MGTRIKIKQGSLVSAALFAALLSGCASTPPAVEGYVAPPAGSTFTYAQHNTGSYVAQLGAGDVQFTTTQGERVWEGRKVITASSTQGVTIVSEPAPSGAMIAILLGDKPFIRYDPPVKFDYPVQAGKEWKKAYQLTLVTGQTLAADTSWKVESFEDVTVPAGTYKTFKVIDTWSTGVQQTIWFSPDLGIWVKWEETRSSGYRAGPGTQKNELVSLNIKK